jgi:hypothetical protein
MCGALVSSDNSDLHDAWHVKLHDHDKTVLAAVTEALGAIESISLLQDIDGERLADLEDR